MEFSGGYYFGVRDYCKQTSRLLAEGPDWSLVCGPNALGKTPYYAEVRLREWPMRLYSHYGKWTNFMREGFKKSLSGDALDASAKVIAEVCELVPNLEALELLRHRVQG